MKVAFDTNIVLDAILQRPDSEAALQLLGEVADDKILGVISANAITDIYYISRKHLNAQQSREAVYALLSLFNVAVIDGDVCMDALGLPMEDYEDAVFAVCAGRENVDYIVTRDLGLIRSEGCPIQAIRPQELLDLLRDA